MNILKKLSIFPLIAVLSGCGQTSENIQKEFNGKNYSLKIASKYEKYAVPNSGYDKNEKQRIKMIKRANDNGDEEVISYNADKALVLEYNTQVLTEMHEIDPEIEIDENASTINGRLLTAPYDASLVKVQGVALANEEERVDAPVGFQEIEFDSLGTYGGGDEHFYKDHMIQPKSIKTKTFDTSTGFSVARSNVYLYNAEFEFYGSANAPREQWLLDEHNNYAESAADVSYEQTKFSVERGLLSSVVPTYESKFDVVIDDFDILPYDELKHVRGTITSALKDFSITLDYYFTIRTDFDTSK